MDLLQHSVEKTVFLKNDRRITVTFKTNVPEIGTYAQVDTGRWHKSLSNYMPDDDDYHHFGQNVHPPQS